MHVGESVLRRPVIPGRRGCDRCSYAGWFRAADLTVVERPRVADGVRPRRQKRRVRVARAEKFTPSAEPANLPGDCQDT